MRPLVFALLLVAQQSLVGTAHAACTLDKVETITSPGFTIDTKDDHQVVEDTINKIKYGLFCENQPSNVDGIDRWFKIPVKSVGIRTPIGSGFLEALGKTSALKAAASPSSLTNPCITNVGSLTDLTSTSAADAKLDVVFSDKKEDTDGKLSVQVPSGDSLTPLQLAEWVVFVGAFFNEAKNAAALFKQIKSAYECHTGNMKYLKDPPHAYWVQYQKTDDEKHYQFLTNAYEKNMLADAGATNNTKEAPSPDTDIDKFQSAVEDAEVVFDQTELTKDGKKVSEWLENFGYKDAPNSKAAFLKQREIYRKDGYRNKNGNSNFPEFALVRPDLVLQDFISILEPEYNKSYTATWLWKLGSTTESTTIIGPDNYDCKAPWMATVPTCSARTDFTGETDKSKGSGPDSGKDSEKDSASEGNDKEKKSGSGRTGKIVGGIIGAIVLIALGFVAMHYYNRHRQQTRLRGLSAGGYGESIGLQNTNSYSRV